MGQSTRKSRRRLTPSARRALIDGAASKVFAERGYEAATTQEIAVEAGVVASVLYDHYPSKRALYISLLERHGRALMKQTIRLPAGTDHRAELRRQIDDYLRAIEEEPFLLRMLFLDQPRDPAIVEVHEDIQARATEGIATALGREISRAHRVLIAEMVKASLTGLARWWSTHGELPRGELAAVATSLLWNGLGETVEGALAESG